MANNQKDIQLIELKDMISGLNTTIKTLNEVIEKQQAELAWFRRKLFGSFSERRTPDITGQMSLFGNTPEEEKPVESIEPEIVPIPKKPRKAKPSLEKQFQGIPTRRVMVDTLTDEEKECLVFGTQMVPIGSELIRSEIIYTPPKLERIEYMATTYAC